MIIKLLNRKEILQYKKLSEINKITFDYLKVKSYKLLKRGIFVFIIENMLCLSKETLNYLLSQQGISINETELLKNLLLYYKEKDDKEYIINLLKRIRYDKIDVSKLDQNELSIVRSIKDIELLVSNSQVSRENLPSLDNIKENEKEVILKYYLNYEDIMKINGIFIILLDNDKDILMNMDVGELLKNDDINIIIIGLLIIIKLNLTVKQIKTPKMLLKLLNEYNSRDDDEKKQLIVKCLTLFINDSIF